MTDVAWPGGGDPGPGPGRRRASRSTPVAVRVRGTRAEWSAGERGIGARRDLVAARGGAVAGPAAGSDQGASVSIIAANSASNTA